MKTLLLTLSLTLLSQQAYAQTNENLNQAVLQTLVMSSGEITLLSETGEPLSAEWQLPTQIAAYLSHGYATVGKSDYIALGDVIVTCEKSSRHKNQYGCGVTFIDGDFAVSRNGMRFEGPESESSLSFHVPVEVDARGRVRLLGQKFRAMLAG